MKSSMSTFKRYEKKYLIDHAQCEAFRRAIAPHVMPDAYDDYSICNIYYDTDTYGIIRNSLEKPVFKEKLRIRSYGTPGSNDTVFVELKKKFKKEVFKRRVSISAAELDAYLLQGRRPDASPQVMGEIEFFLSFYQPEPKIYIAYEREALQAKADESIRITFDRNIRFRVDDLRLSDGDYGMPILDEHMRLMEVKVRGAMPLWLSRALDEQQIYPTSFSKYGHCYENYIAKDSGRFKNLRAWEYVS